MKRKPETTNCPLCDEDYHRGNPITRHHIFPRFWYICNVKVEVCRSCHDDFNRQNPMNHIWSIPGCVTRWVKFCSQFKKNAYRIYPILHELKNKVVYVK